MKDVNDLMQAILEMDAAQRRESEKARLERSARLAALDEQKQKIIAECDARDLDTFKARFARTKYGPLLGHHEYSVLKEGFFHYRCDWFRKWLRFSTDPTLVMLCYVWLARCEVQDLDHIIEGVHYKLPSEDVQPLLVGFDEKD